MSLKVLVIDDSAYNRQIISEVLESHDDIEVVGKADDGEQGLKLAAALKPDLITLDIEMPRMDGFTFLRLLMSRMPTPVIVISSHSRKQEVFQALELGALDFVAKPERYLPPEGERLRDEILRKVLAVKSLQVIPFQNRTAQPSDAVSTPGQTSRARKAVQEEPTKVQRLILIGASTGGPPALQSVLKAIVEAPDTAVCIAQHMPEKFTKAFADRLNRVAALNVMEAEDRLPLRSGYVYVAPGGAHLTVALDGQGDIHTVLQDPEATDRYVPSIDHLFTSAAQLPSTIKKMAIVLTGMGSDGSLGIRDVHGANGQCIAESRESAIVFGMPKEAIATRCVHEILPLDGIIEKIQQFAGGN